MKIGFTGTSSGMTGAQADTVARILKDLGASSLHHGDCVGADAQAHGLARGLGVYVVGHPPTNPKARAFCDFDEYRVPRPYLDRNHDIVDETELLVAAPKGPEELRSGTWATVRYAMKRTRPIIIVGPSGRTFSVVQREEIV